MVKKYKNIYSNQLSVKILLGKCNVFVYLHLLLYSTRSPTCSVPDCLCVTGG